jgi:integrase
MSYSTHLYLNGQLSEKYIKHVNSSADSSLWKQVREQIENKQLQIFLYLRFDGRTIKVSVERKCTQKQWAGGQVNPRFYRKGAIELNQYLDKIQQETAKLHEKNLANGRITIKEDLMSIIDLCNNRTSSKVVTLESAFEEFILVSKLTKTEGTLKTYRTTLKHLRNFSRIKRTPLQFERVNAKFESGFRGYLLIDCGMTNNSIAKYIQIFKTFMLFCTEDRDYNSKLNTAYKKFDTSDREKEVYALTIDELFHLFNFPFRNKSHSQVRDVFCFMAFTGLRFSDAEKLQWDDISETCIRLLPKKTKSAVIVPLNKFALSIMEKYKRVEKPLPTISNQKTNEALHEIGKLIGLNTLVKVTQFKGAYVEEKYVPKYEVLTTHLGRKTFITNSLVLGMHERTLKEIGAPRSQKSFNRYVSFVDSYKEKAVNDAWNDENIRKVQ